MTDIVERLRYEADAMQMAPSGEDFGDTLHAINWADKPHRVLYDATGWMRKAADTISALTAERDALLAALAEATADHAMVTELYNAAVSDYTGAREQLAEAVEALEPFAKRDVQWSLNTDHARISVKLGDLRRARDVVEKAKGRNHVEKQNSGDNP